MLLCGFSRPAQNSKKIKKKKKKGITSFKTKQVGKSGPAGSIASGERGGKPMGRARVPWCRGVGSIFVRIAIALTALRCAGHFARVYRNRILGELIEHTLHALEVNIPEEGTCRNISSSGKSGGSAAATTAASAAKLASGTVAAGLELEEGGGGVGTTAGKGFDAFLDWSSLLGVWRDAGSGGVLYDEEDADLGVIVPDGQTADDVAELLRAKFAQVNFSWPHQLQVEVDHPVAGRGDDAEAALPAAGGLVYVVPEYNRLHLDLYLVRYDADRNLLRPMWPSPTRSDSHAAATHARPISGICALRGFPCPANSQEYLESLYGYLGADARYNADTMLYEPKHSPSSDSGSSPSANVQLGLWRAVADTSTAALAWLTHVGHLLSRDAYFLVIMMPVHESVRRFAESRYETWVDAAVEAVCGRGRSFRDCF